MRKTYTLHTIAILLLSLLLSDALPAQEMVTVPAGTRLVVFPNTTLNSAKNKTGDRFSVILAADLTADGVLVARRGDKIFGAIVESKKAGRVVRKAGMVLELNDIVIDNKMYPIVCHQLDLTGEKTGDLKKVTVKGAIGGVIGGAEQARRMAGMGMAVAIITPGKQIEVLDKALIEFYLSQPATLPALAQPLVIDAGQTATRYLQVNGQNMKALTRYSWTSQLEVNVKGEVKTTKRMFNHFDEHGKMVVEPIGAQEQKKKRGIRGKIQKKKQTKMQELADQIGETTRSYTMMTPEMTQFLFQRGSISQSDDGAIQVEGIDIINPGDWIALWIDGQSYRPRKLIFKTVMGEEGLQAEVEYRKLPDGTFYAAVSEIFMPGKKLLGTLENFNHMLDM